MMSSECGYFRRYTGFKLVKCKLKYVKPNAYHV